jgi:hypothetical protein
MKEEADHRHLDLSLDQAREQIYGMSYEQWKALYQREASPDQIKTFKAVEADPSKHG